MARLSPLLTIALLVPRPATAVKQVAKATASSATRALWICKPEIQQFILEHAGTTGYLLQECRKVYPDEACASAQRALGDGPDLFTRMRQLCAGYGSNFTDGYDPLASLPQDIRDQIISEGKDRDGHTITIGGGNGISINGKSPWGHIPGPGEIVRDLRNAMGGGSGDGVGGVGGDGGVNGDPSNGAWGGIYPPGVHVPGPHPHFGDAGAGQIRTHGPLLTPAARVGNGIDQVVDGVSGTIKGLFGRADPTANNGDARDGRRITGPAVPTEQVPYLDASLRGKQGDVRVGKPFDWERYGSDDGTRMAEAANAVRIYGAEKGDHIDHVEGMRVDEEDRPFDISHPLVLPNVSGNRSAAQPMPNISTGPPPISGGVQSDVLPPLAVVANAARDAANVTGNTSVATAEAIAAAIETQMADTTTPATAATIASNATLAPAPTPATSADPETLLAVGKVPIMVVTTFPPLAITVPARVPATTKVPTEARIIYSDRDGVPAAATNFFKIASRPLHQGQQAQQHSERGLYFPPRLEQVPEQRAMEQSRDEVHRTRQLPSQQDTSSAWTGLRGSPVSTIAAAVGPPQAMQ